MKTPQNWKPGALLRKGVSVLGAALVAGAVCAANVVTHEAPRFSLPETPAAGKARLYPGIGLSCWMNDDGEVEDGVRLAKQIQAVRDLGLGGFTVFNLDRRAEAALPLLRLGVTKDD